MTPEHPHAAPFDATMLLSLQGNPQVPPQVPIDPFEPMDTMSPMSPMSQVSQEMHGFEGELARLLQSAAASDAAAEAAAAAAAATAMPTAAAAMSSASAMSSGMQSGMADVEPGVVAAHRHRKRRRSFRWRRRRTASPGTGPPWWMRLANLLLASAAVSIVSMLSVLGGVISYEPLRGAASTGVSGTLADWWPLLIYGPWLVASLSILRAALHQRRVVHSWVVMILFSGLAVGLCVVSAPREVTEMAVAGLPPVSALIAFHQLVRQISLVHTPRHALPRQRRRL